MNVQEVDISILKTNLNNVKNHGKKSIDSIKKSLIQFKQYKPLIINEDNEILIGKGTFLAMKQLKYKTAFVYRISISKQKQNQLIVLDNRTSQLSEIDNDVIQKIFFQIDNQNINLTAYTDKQVEKIMNQLHQKQQDDQTEKANIYQITCPYCKTKFSIEEK